MSNKENNRIRDLIVTYGLYLSRRESMKQKTQFLKQVLLDFEPLGYKVVGITEKVRLLTSMNIHIGDVANADILFIAHYDRPFKVFFRKFYHPFGKGNTLFSKLFSENIVIMMILGCGLLLYLIGLNLHQEWLKLIVIFGVPFGLGASVTRFPKGLRNKSNFNKNNAALITMILLAEKIAQKKFHNTAFVLTDNECLNHHGDIMLKRYLEKKKAHATVIHLDSIGQGKIISVGSSEQCVELAKKISELYPVKDEIQQKTYVDKLISESSLHAYPNSVNITVGELRQDDVFVSRVCCSQDTNIDYPVIEKLVEYLYKITRMLH